MLDDIDPELDAMMLVIQELESGGWPSDEELASNLRGPCDLPRELRLHIADRIEGKLKKKRGRPSIQGSTDTIHRDLAINAIYRDLVGSGCGDAVAATAQTLSSRGWGVSSSTVRNVVYGRKYQD